MKLAVNSRNGRCLYLGNGNACRGGCPRGELRWREITPHEYDSDQDDEHKPLDAIYAA